MPEGESTSGRIGWPLRGGLLVVLIGLGYFAYATFGSSEGAPDPAPLERRAVSGDRPRASRARGASSRAHPRRGARRSGAGLAPEPPATEAQDRVYDPQRAAMLRSFRVTSADAGDALPFEPLERAGTISSVSGSAPFGRDASCTARVLPARSGRFNCLVRVVCGGRVIYPNQAQTAGFMRCDLDASGRPQSGEDRGHTALDGDPQIRFDLAAGTLVVEDRGDGVDRFRVAMQLR